MTHSDVCAGTRISVDEGCVTLAYLAVHFVLFVFVKINVEWFKKEACHKPFCSTQEMSCVISDVSSTSVFSFRKWGHSLTGDGAPRTPVMRARGGTPPFS